MSSIKLIFSLHYFSKTTAALPSRRISGVTQHSSNCKYYYGIDFRGFFAIVLKYVPLKY
jgi:hypothetical protein